MSPESAAANPSATWFWKVQEACSLVREALRTVLIPSSHICVDESAIKFHGRSANSMKLPHKPAKEGFILYALCSHGGILHDFQVYSAKHGIEGVPQGITVNLPTKSVRKRKRGATGIVGDEVHLPPIRSMVYMLCERLTIQHPGSSFICFMDNLFNNVPLARALLTINVGICGTTRANALGIPPVLQALRHKFPAVLKIGQLTGCVINDLILTIAWNDNMNDRVVTMMTTAYRPLDTTTATRSCRPEKPTRSTP